MATIDHPRGIRSFVLRSGRITTAQRRALETEWPRYGIDGDAPLDLDAVFGRQSRRIVEIGFGHGENLLALAAAAPGTDFLGIEVHRAGVGKLLLEAAALGLTNLRVVAEDAADVVGRRLPDASIDEILVFFPDPWPKKRHHKRRLIQPAFVERLSMKLKPGGFLRLATDWADYAEHMLITLNGCALLENVAPSGGFCERAPTRPPTHFEKRGERLGHGVWDLSFRRKQASGR